MPRTHINNIFSRDVRQFRLAQGARTKSYLTVRRVRSDVATSEIGSIPLGFRYFPAPLRYDFVGVAAGYTFLVVPCGVGKIVENAARIYY